MAAPFLNGTELAGLAAMTLGEEQHRNMTEQLVAHGIESPYVALRIRARHEDAPRRAQGRAEQRNATEFILGDEAKPMPRQGDQDGERIEMTRVVGDEDVPLARIEPGLAAGADARSTARERDPGEVAVAAADQGVRGPERKRSHDRRGSKDKGVDGDGAHGKRRPRSLPQRHRAAAATGANERR